MKRFSVLIHYLLFYFLGNADTIKKRWQLALFSYKRYTRERGKYTEDKLLPKYCRNLPVAEMIFLK